MSSHSGLASDEESSVYSNNSDIQIDDNTSHWNLIPEPVLLKILNSLSARDILNAGESCRRWNCIAKDNYLWRKIFQRDFKVDPIIGLKPGERYTHKMHAKIRRE